MYYIWNKTLDMLSEYPRPDFLTRLSALGAIYGTIGNNQTVIDATLAIQDITRWWP